MRPPAILVHLLLVSCSLIAAEQAAVAPPPSETPCEVIINGHTSTLKSIVIRKTGHAVPKIYGGRHTAGNTPGFDWYVSQHYALKTELKENEAREFLTHAELAYPHYVEVIGQEPPGIETTRMAFVHATNLDRLQVAVRSDIGTHWAGNGGGVTLPADWVAYSFPSGGLRYHRNDLSIHENLHLLQCCVQEGIQTPHRFTEGITYFFSNHVYDPARQQLTVAVFDKAPINNPIDAVLAQIRKEGAYPIADYLDPRKDRSVALWTAFFWSDPLRLMKWRIWRDEMLGTPLTGDAARQCDADVMHKLYGGSLEPLEKEWAAWLKDRQNTFTHIDWGWEQWGGTLQSYGWPWKKELFSQMNINYPPGKELATDPLRLDYPQPEPSPLVGEVRFGGATPSVGCVVDFSKTNSSGWAGMGLGVQDRDLFRAVIEGNRKLTLDGTRLKFQAARRDADFTEEVLAAAKKTGCVGVTLKIGEKELEATVRAGAGEELKSMTLAYPLTTDERSALLTRPLALLSRDGRHWITPYLDANVPPGRDLSKPAAPNRWGFAADHEAYRLFRAAWRLEAKAPPSLIALRDEMVTAMSKEPAAQEAAIQAYNTRLPKVIKDVEAAGGPEAVAELSGFTLTSRLSRPSADGKSILTAYLRNGEKEAVSGELTSCIAGATGAPQPIPFTVEPGREQAIEIPLTQAASVPGPFCLTLRATFAFHQVPATRAVSRWFRSGISSFWVIGPFDNKGDGQVDTPQSVEQDAFDSAKAYAGRGGKQLQWTRVERKPTTPLAEASTVDFVEAYGDLKNISVYATVWVNAPEETTAVLACGSDDGLVVWLNGERIHTNLKNRGYSRGEDRVPVVLKKGTNQLLFRVTQTWGGWALGAELLDKSGAPLPGVTFTLEPPGKR